PGIRACDHVGIDAVLAAARGAVPLHLDVEGGLHVGTDMVELHEGRASDGGGDGGQRSGVAGPFGGRHRLRSLAFLFAGGDPRGGHILERGGFDKLTGRRPRCRTPRTPSAPRPPPHSMLRTWPASSLLPCEAPVPR